MTRHRLLGVLGAAALVVSAGCSSQVDEAPEEAPTTEQAATDGETAEYEEGILDRLAEEQASARAEAEAQLTVRGGLVLTPDVSLVTDDGDCLPLIPQQSLHDRVTDLMDEPQVQILDASGSIVGTAQMEQRLSSTGDACMFYFETRVSRGGGYYTATVESFTTDAVAESDAEDGEILLDLNDDL
ncbi:hypothetical protein [Pseudactinotalea sp. Z1732]|uniref:hypothetical protein n=1 Tax=Micrococcales TaxID=85006 RepID=UPI003C7EA0D3